MLTKVDYLKPEIGMSDSDREGVVQVLSQVLADQHVLYTKLRKYHWNIVGPRFLSVHELLEQQYNDVKTRADEVAERIRAYGEPAIGTLQEFLDHSRIDEEPGEYPDDEGMISNLVRNHESIIQALRDDIDTVQNDHEDEATADLLIAIAQEHLEMAWMLRSFLQSQVGHAS